LPKNIKSTAVKYTTIIKGVPLYKKVFGFNQTALYYVKVLAEYLYYIILYYGEFRVIGTLLPLR